MSIESTALDTSYIRLHPDDIDILAKKIAEYRIAPEKWITTEELSAAMGIPIKTIYNYTSTTNIPHVRRGNRCYFQLSKVDKWYSERR